ncbi:MAG: hydrogenase maturation protease [Actinomycetota bacterium]|nr:hydrogenase maturation protease [Actinomycetota bacterium]
MTPSRNPPAPGTRAWDLGVAGMSGADASPTSPLVIVGLGNDIASDDGIGIHAALALDDRFRRRTDIEIVALPWAGFALLDVLRDRRSAVLIDGLATGTRPPGTVVRIDEDDLAGSVRLNSFHDINYPTVMALGRSMGWEMPEHVAIWGIEMAIADEFGESLTPEVADSIEIIVNEVTRFIETIETSTNERAAQL